MPTHKEVMDSNCMGTMRNHRNDMQLVEAYIHENSTNLREAINKVNHEGFTLFAHAVYTRDFLLLERLMDIPEVNPNITPAHQFAPLTYASNFDANLLENVLAFPGVNIHIKSYDAFSVQQTALHKCNLYSVPYLLRAGMNIDEVADGDTPLMLEVKWNPRVEFIKMMLEANASVNVVDDKGDSLLHVAVRQENPHLCLEVLELLLAKVSAFKLNVVNAEGQTPYVLFKRRKREFEHEWLRYSRLLEKLNHNKLTSSISFEERLKAITDKATDDAELQSIPDLRWRCPIKQTLMDEPLMVASGRIYDRSTIHELVKSSDEKLSELFLDPFTRQELNIKTELTREIFYDLRNEINDFLTKLELKHQIIKPVEQSVIPLADDVNTATLSHTQSYVVNTQSNLYLKCQSWRAIKEFMQTSFMSRRYPLAEEFKQSFVDFAVEFLQKHPEFRPHSFISILLMDYHSSYVLRADKREALFELAISELRKISEYSSAAYKQAIEKLIKEASLSADKLSCPESISSALAALWQTVFVLKNPRYQDVYKHNIAELFIGHPSPKLKRMGSAMMAIGALLAVAATLTVVCTMGAALPLVAICIAASLGACAVGLTSNGIRLFCSGRRQGVSSAAQHLMELDSKIVSCVR